MNSVKIDKGKATRITRTLHLRIGLSFIGQTKSIDAYADAAATDSAGAFAPLIRSQSMIASSPNKIGCAQRNRIRAATLFSVSRNPTAAETETSTTINRAHVLPTLLSNR